MSKFEVFNLIYKSPLDPLDSILLCFHFTECETPVELGFLVDQSGSINVENFEKVKNFILGVIAGFNASREGTHIGIIKYSTDATTVLRFNEFDDPNFDYENLNQTLQNALDLPSGGKTRIDLALRKADRDLFSGPSRYRTFVPKVRKKTFIICFEAS